MIPQNQEKSAFKIICRATLTVLAIIFISSGSRLEAQVLAIPANMPILYEEIPEYVLARSRARYKLELPQCTIESRGGGYAITSGDREFIILNQNPACLKRFVGKMSVVQGRTTENVVSWNRLYFVVIDAINGMRYEGRVAPWMMREPTDEEICYWNLHQQLPPATQKFLNYLALQKPASGLQIAASEAGCGTLAYNRLASEPQRSLPVTGVSRQLTDIQRQLTVIEQKVNKQPYQGLYSIPSDNWNATDLSLYMDSQGGG
jgi:hypothetical protein